MVIMPPSVERLAIRRAIGCFLLGDSFRIKDSVVLCSRLGSGSGCKGCAVVSVQLQGYAGTGAKVLRHGVVEGERDVAGEMAQAGQRTLDRHHAAETRHPWRRRPTANVHCTRPVFSVVDLGQDPVLAAWARGRPVAAVSTVGVEVSIKRSVVIACHVDECRLDTEGPQKIVDAHILVEGRDRRMDQVAIRIA